MMSVTHADELFSFLTHRFELDDLDGDEDDEDEDEDLESDEDDDDDDSDEDDEEPETWQVSPVTRFR